MTSFKKKITILHVELKKFLFQPFLVQSRWIHCIHILVYREELSTDLEHIFEGDPVVMTV